MAGVLILTTFHENFGKHFDNKLNNVSEIVKFQFDDFKSVGSILVNMMNGKLK